MAPPKIAVLDSSVLILVGYPVLPSAPNAARTKERQRLAEETIKQLRAQSFEPWVPAPVVAELYKAGGEAIIDALVGQNRRSLVASLDNDSARIAAAMLSTSLGELRDASSSRNCIKFDALIAAIAHHLAATFLVTADPRLFEKYLRQVGSSVRVLRADEANELAS